MSTIQQLTFYQPEPRKVTITKKHFAVILFAWWLLIQFYQFVVLPSGIFVYESLFVEGTMKTYDSQSQNKEQQIQKGCVENQKSDKPSFNTNFSDSTQKEKKSTIEIDFLQQHGKDKVQIQKIEQADINNCDKKVEYLANEEFKLNFRIKGKGRTFEEMKKKAAEQSLKQAMEKFLFRKKKERRNRQSTKK